MVPTYNAVNTKGYSASKDICKLYCRRPHPLPVRNDAFIQRFKKQPHFYIKCQLLTPMEANSDKITRYLTYGSPNLLPTGVLLIHFPTIDQHP
jgi:hypothetical protein